MAGLRWSFVFLDVFEEEGKDGVDRQAQDSGDQDVEFLSGRNRIEG